MLAGDSVQQAHSAVAGPTPRFDCSISQNGQFLSWAQLLINSGCKINALITTLANRMKLAVKTVDPAAYDICDANGRKGNIVG